MNALTSSSLFSSSVVSKLFILDVTSTNSSESRDRNHQTYIGPIYRQVCSHRSPGIFYLSFDQNPSKPRDQRVGDFDVHDRMQNFPVDSD